MSSYSDFLRTHTGEKARARRLYWVCGQEPALRQLVLERIEEMLPHDPMHFIHLYLREISESEMWAVLNQHPVDTRSPRVIVVHDAELLLRTQSVAEWVKSNQKARVRSATVVFMAEDPQIPELAAGSSLLVVKCSLPQNPDAREKRAIEIVAGWGVEPRVAKALLHHVGFDLSEARAAVLKMEYLELPLDAEVIPYLVPHQPGTDFVDALLRVKKKEAMEAREGTDPASVIPLLGTHLAALSLIQRHLVVKSTIKEIAQATGLKEAYVRMLYGYARFYPRREAIRRTLLLERLDRAQAAGAEEGVLEALVTSW